MGTFLAVKQGESKKGKGEQKKQDRNYDGSHCLKVTQNVAFEFMNFGTFHQFFPIKADLSGNTV